MTWQELAEYVLGEIQYDLDNPGHLNEDIATYVRASAERIAFLEKALEQAMCNAYVLGGYVYGGHYGSYIGAVDELPEFAKFIQERADHIVDAQEMVGEDQK